MLTTVFFSDLLVLSSLIALLLIIFVAKGPATIESTVANIWMAGNSNQIFTTQFLTFFFSDFRAVSSSFFIFHFSYVYLSHSLPTVVIIVFFFHPQRHKSPLRIFSCFFFESEQLRIPLLMFFVEEYVSAALSFSSTHGSAIDMHCMPNSIEYERWATEICICPSRLLSFFIFAIIWEKVVPEF